MSVSSLFLAVFVLMLPHADTGRAIRVVGVYALVFGLLVFLAALRFRQSYNQRKVVK